jgi:hypothetical protein
VNVFDDVASFASEWKWRWGVETQGDDVSGERADFDGVEAEDAMTEGWWIGRPRRVAVIREDDEREPGLRRRRSDSVYRARTIRTCGVNVVRAEDDRRRHGRRDRLMPWRKREAEVDAGGDRDGRHDDHERPQRS